MEQCSVRIQISEASQPSLPTFWGEVAAFAQVLTHEGILKALQEQTRFVRARFGTYDLIDVVAALIGYAVSDEPTALAFYERLTPFARPFMAFLGATSSPIAQPFLASWRLLTRARWKRFGRSFRRIFAVILPTLQLPAEFFDGGDIVGQTLPCQHTQFNLGNVEPGCMPGRVVNFQTVNEGFGLCRRKHVVKRSGDVRIEVVQHDHNLACSLFEDLSHE